MSPLAVRQRFSSRTGLSDQQAHDASISCSVIRTSQSDTASPYSTLLTSLSLIFLYSFVQSRNLFSLLFFSFCFNLWNMEELSPCRPWLYGPVLEALAAARAVRAVLSTSSLQVRVSSKSLLSLLTWLTLLLTFSPLHCIWALSAKLIRHFTESHTLKLLLLWSPFGVYSIV